MTDHIIDCHTHVGVDWFWNSLGVQPNSHTIKELSQKMRAAKVSKAVVFPMASSPYYTIESMKSGNPEISGIEKFPYEKSNKNLVDELSYLDDESRKMFIPFFCFNPRAKVDEQLDFLSQSLRNELGGLKGLKYHPYASQTHITDQSNRPFLEFAQAYSLPIVLHYGLDEFSNGSGFIDLVNKYDRIRFSLAHIVRFDDNILSQINDIPNLFFDVSCLSGECQMALDFQITEIYRGYSRREYNFQNPLEVLNHLIEEFPSSILWGTDEPFTKLIDEQGHVHYNSSFTSEVKILRSLDNQYIRRIALDNPADFLQLK